jgi:catechol 2,3-dioxygenase-like lactoylglutathione lyase family enzyme
MIYHTAIRVGDIETAIRRYGRSLNLRFRPPVLRRYPRMRSAWGDTPFEGLMTYSVEGPVHVELLQPLSPLSGIWRDTGHDRLHHIGLWSTDPSRQSHAMRADGFAWDTSLVDEDGSEPVIFVRRGSMLIELVSQHRRPRFQAWVSGNLAVP